MLEVGGILGLKGFEVGGIGGGMLRVEGRGQCLGGVRWGWSVAEDGTRRWQLVGDISPKF